VLNALYIYGILTLLLRNYCYNILHLLHFIISLLGFHLKFTASVLFASLKQIIFCSSNSVVFSKYYCHNTCPKILQYYLSFLILLLKYILSTFSPGSTGTRSLELSANCGKYTPTKLSFEMKRINCGQHVNSKKWGAYKFSHYTTHQLVLFFAFLRF
jgi:hypothetical protein